jgi:hypothetical protein
MTVQSAQIKAYEEKIRAELQKTKAHVVELEARAKSDFAQAQIDLLKDVKAFQKEIEEKLHELKTTGDGNAEQVKTYIDAKMAKLKSSLEQLAGKVKAHAKAS